MSLAKSIRIPHSRVLQEDFYILMESHIPMLRKHPNTREYEVNGQQAEKYKGDFHGLLQSLDIVKKYHYIITRVNHFNASTDYDGFQTRFVVPDTQTMDMIFSIYNSIED